MKKLLLFITASLCAGAFGTHAATRVRLDNGWRTTADIKPGYTDSDFDDRRWKAVTLPHDWSICFNPDSTANTGNDGGYFPGLKATYRYTLPVDSLMPGTYYIYVEGAYMNPAVWINGEEVDSHVYGYSPFRVDITEYLEQGDNSLVITVDNTSQKNCRWYSGTGLYRPVWLEHCNEAYIDHESMVFTSPGIRPGMAIGRMEANLIDTRAAGNKFTGTLTVTEPDGTALQPEVFAIDMKPGAPSAPVQVDFPIPDPKLWSPDTPNLYTATLSIADGNGEVDSETITFGLRTFDYDAEEGAFLNDQPITLNGACVHHDNGMLGAAAYSAAEWRKVMLLKRAGFNAVRTSHNAPSKAFLDACDHLGLLVIDEAFDGWAEKKTPHDYGEVFDSQWQTDLEAMILRDRNHPSIIAWSIGNEIMERKSSEAVEIAGEMAEACRRLDPTRPVTQALASWDADWEIYDPLAAQHDIIGYNYLIDKVEEDHKRVPERVVWQTESYPRDAWNNYLKVRDLPYVIGDFVWTGIDYLGESGIGRSYYAGQVPGEHFERPLWPWHAAQCGDIDLTGQRKPISYYRDMLHNNRDTVYVAVREPNGYKGEIKETMWGTYPTYKSWDWQGHEGKPIEIEVITRYPEVKLLVNGKPAGKAKVNESTGYKAVFSIPYEPGTVTAVALDAKGKEVATDSIVTAGAPAGIALSFERISTPDTDYDLIFIDAAITDSNGVVNTLDETLLTFSVTGNAELLATGNADPTDLTGYTLPMRQAHRGRAAAVVKAPRHTAPTLTVTSANLPAKSIILTTNTK